jgi:hypothetical protein
MKHVRPYAQLNESVPHNGIVLIKGKPKGKNKERMLYAGHVMGSAELKPGATMLFMSDQFYRIIKDGDRLRGVKINWRSEESLKDSLNLKSPGKISLVKNNTKTPYHWKTLKETSISQALDRVRDDLGGSDYLFESVTPSISGSKYLKFLNAAVDSIFGEEKRAVVLSWSSKDALDLVDPDESQVNVEHEALIEFIYTDPELVRELEEIGASTRGELHLEISSDLSYSSWHDPGDYMNPPDGDTEITDADHTIISSSLSIDGLGDEDFDDSELDPISKKIEKALSGSSDLDDFLTSSPRSYPNFRKYFNV